MDPLSHLMHSVSALELQTSVEQPNRAHFLYSCCGAASPAAGDSADEIGTIGSAEDTTRAPTLEDEVAFDGEPNESRPEAEGVDVGDADSTPSRSDSLSALCGNTSTLP